jgi:hypothetical protein
VLYLLLEDVRRWIGLGARRPVEQT